MKSKLTSAVYDVPEVAKACERAEAAAAAHGCDQEVWVDPDCPSRTWRMEAGNWTIGMVDKVLVFSTADGGRLIE